MSIRATTSSIVHSLGRRRSAAVGIDGGPRLNVASGFCDGEVLLLGITEEPDLTALDPLPLYTDDCLVLISCTGSPSIRQ